MISFGVYLVLFFVDVREICVEKLVMLVRGIDF